jgi:hypothetical protein
MRTDLVHLIPRIEKVSMIESSQAADNSQQQEHDPRHDRALVV